MAAASLEQLTEWARISAPMAGAIATVLPIEDLDHIDVEDWPTDSDRIDAIELTVAGGERIPAIWLHGGAGTPGRPWRIENLPSIERLAGARLGGATHVIVWDYGGALTGWVDRYRG